MNCKYIIILLAVVASCLLGQQVREQKLGVALKLLLSKKSGSAAVLTAHFPVASGGLLNVFICGNTEIISKNIKNVGGYVNTVTPGILSAQIPESAVELLAALPAVESIRLAPGLSLKNEQAVRHVQADKVHRGNDPLRRRLTGKNVIVGIIDTGIDWKHADFRLPGDSSKSRILSIWDQHDNTGKHPGEFSYGSEWTGEQINAELSRTPPGIVKHRDVNGHGTHVAGTAAGKNGLAPEADLIVVGIDFGTANSLVDGANYIYQKAQQLGRPAVINASLGSSIGPHDGSSEACRMLDALVLAAPGRAFISAVGNEGAKYIHYGGFEHGEKLRWTYVHGNNPQEPFRREAKIALYAIIDQRFEESLSFAVGLDSTTTGAYHTIRPARYIRQTVWKTLAEIKQQSTALSYSMEYTDGTPAGSVALVASDLGRGRNKTELLIIIKDRIRIQENQPIKGLDFWRICSRGEGLFHLWAFQGMTLPKPAERRIRVDDAYRFPDNQYSVVMPATGQKVLSVGAYTNRFTYTDINGKCQPAPGRRSPEGALAFFSSHGPTLDGRLKPEISAPGRYVSSALSEDSGIKHHSSRLTDATHMVGSGTSMATPVTTGTVALLFQENPDLNIEQVRSRICRYPLTDIHTRSHGALPNNIWGHGKLNSFGALTMAASSITNPDAVATNNFWLSRNYPNPFNPTTMIRYYLPRRSQVLIRVYDLLGREVRTLVERIEIAGVKSVSWDARNNAGHKVASGIYLYKMQAGTFTQTHKMILLN